jgi:hypothetical protein
VSSVRLWRGLEAEGAAKRRALDPLWVLVLVAGVLAGMALARPRWVAGTPAERLEGTWAVRSVKTAGGETEAWVRCPEASDTARLHVNGVERFVSAAELRQGAAVPVHADSLGHVRLEIRSGHAVAAATFADTGQGPPFGFLAIAASGADVDPALRRVFAVQPAARVGDPTVRPRVLLVQDPQVRVEDLEDADLVIAQPSSPLPGITLGAEVKGEWLPQVESGSGFDWPKFVSLKDVHVRTLRQAILGAEWRVIATADAKPWIVTREIPRGSGGKALWLWLGSSALAETDWVKDPGFVLFFAEMQQRAFGGEAKPYVDWTKLPETDVTGNTVAVELTPYLGAAGILLLLGATTWFVRRMR